MDEDSLYLFIEEDEEDVAANVLVYDSELDPGVATSTEKPTVIYNIKSEPNIEQAEDEVVTELEELEEHPDDIKKEIVYELVEDDGVQEYEVTEEVMEEPEVNQYQVHPLNLMGKDHDYEMVGLEEFYCGMCGKVFTNAKSVSIHMSRTHIRGAEKPEPVRVRKVICEMCGKKYASYAALRYHQRVHTGEKPFRCKICSKAFTMPLFLQIHLRTHTGERPYECPSCPKAFSNRAALLRHERVHTGVKPYTCPECGKSFTQSNSMKLHVRTVHMKLPAPYKSKARRLKALQRQRMKAKLVEVSAEWPEETIFKSEECDSYEDQEAEKYN